MAPSAEIQFEGAFYEIRKDVLKTVTWCGRNKKQKGIGLIRKQKIHGNILISKLTDVATDIFFLNNF